MEKRYLSAAETAKLVRQALKAAFPSFKGFSVRSKTYSGGASMNVSWTDGPTAAMVDRVVQPFAGASFDGMQDLKTYHTSILDGQPVHFGADFIFTNRHESREFLELAMARGAAKYGAAWLKEAGIELKTTSFGSYIETRDVSGSYWFNKMRQNMLPNGVVVELKAA